MLCSNQQRFRFSIRVALQFCNLDVILVGSNPCVAPTIQPQSDFKFLKEIPLFWFTRFKRPLNHWIENARVFAVTTWRHETFVICPSRIGPVTRN